MIYEGSFPFYGPTKRGRVKLYAVHVWCMRPHFMGGNVKKFLVMSMHDQPGSGFESMEELDEYMKNKFIDKQMFDEWAKDFNSYGVKITSYQRKTLKPYIFKKRNLRPILEEVYKDDI
jgi:hypothetical protein